MPSDYGVFDEDPPLLLRNHQSGSGAAKGRKLNRVYFIGVSKKF